jgi:hypothetical protein
MTDNSDPQSNASPPAAQQPKSPPPAIQWETDLISKSQEPSSLGNAALDVVRKVIRGDNADG